MTGTKAMVGALNKCTKADSMEYTGGPVAIVPGEFQSGLGTQI